MTNCVRIFLLFGFSCLGATAFAETMEVEIKVYGVAVEQDETSNSTSGHVVDRGGLSHETTVYSNGEVFSQWCSGTTVNNGDAEIGAGGYCAGENRDGDYLWIWWRSTGPDSNDWGVIGGSGRYAGATGGGTNKVITQFPDGRAWTSEAKGTIKTP